MYETQKVLILTNNFGVLTLKILPRLFSMKTNDQFEYHLLVASITELFTSQWVINTLFMCCNGLELEDQVLSFSFAHYELCNW